MNNIIEYIFIRCLIILVAIIPFKLLYLISDCCSFVLQYVIRYRSITIVDNLINAFPEKSIEEIKALTRKFYKHLCDVILESIKGYSLSTNKLLKRYIFLNPIVVNQFYEKGQDVIMAMSHYCNWEWGSLTAGTVLKHKLVSLYKPMSNKYTDKYFLKLRKKTEYGSCVNL